MIKTHSNTCGKDEICDTVNHKFILSYFFIYYILQIISGRAGIDLF